jgi:hypothetical protein
MPPKISPTITAAGTGEPTADRAGHAQQHRKPQKEGNDILRGERGHRNELECLRLVL